MSQLLKTEQVLHEMKKYQLDVLALSEVRCTGSGEKQLDNQCIILYCGPESRHEKGVALMMTRETSIFLLNWAPVSSRIFVARFSDRQAKLFVAVCYALTNVIEIECKEEFCRTLQSVDIPRNYIKCILGDLNVVVRNDESYCPLALGRHGMGV